MQEEDKKILLKERLYQMTLFSPYYDDYDSTDKRIHGFHSTDSISSDHIKKLVHVAKILNCEYYEITRRVDDWRVNTIRTSPALRRYRTIEKRKEEEERRIEVERLAKQKIEMDETIEEIRDSVPEKMELKDEDTDTVLLTVKRTIPDIYRSSYVNCQITLSYCKRSWNDGIREYIRIDGGLMIKKFSEDMDSLFGKENTHFMDAKTTLKDIYKLYIKMKDAIDTCGKVLINHGQ